MKAKKLILALSTAILVMIGNVAQVELGLRKVALANQIVITK